MSIKRKYYENDYKSALVDLAIEDGTIPLDGNSHSIHESIQSYAQVCRHYQRAIPPAIILNRLSIGGWDISRGSALISDWQFTYVHKTWNQQFERERNLLTIEEIKRKIRNGEM